MNLCRFRHAFLALALVLAWFGLAPMGQAVTPEPDGFYPNANTAEGRNALFSLDVTQGQANTAVGYKALYSATTAHANTAVGDSALENNNGWGNTAVGFDVLDSNTTGQDNTAVGTAALFGNISGDENTATGAGALYGYGGNGTGSQNTATGVDTLYHNGTGSSNTATGFQALFKNESGNSNTANGYQTLYSNINGGGNTASGRGAMYTNSNGFGNTATGNGALYYNASGDDNTAIGASALFHNTADRNTATGDTALYSNLVGTDNTGNGYRALVNCTGNHNIAIGSGAGSNLTTGSHNIYLAALGNNESNTIRIGRSGVQTKAFMQGISGVAVTGSAVQVTGTGQLGVLASSGRLKDEIKPMGRSSEAILALKPVTFRYKEEIDPERLPQFGLVAEEVEEIDPSLITRDAEGRPYTVRYDAVNAMLLNEFLKEHQKNAEQQATITALKSNDAKQEATIAQQQKQIDSLGAALQKVSAQLEVGKANPQTVLNNVKADGFEELGNGR